MKDLGVYFDRQLKWKFHIDFKLSTSNRQFFHIKRNVPFCVPMMIKFNVYRSYVLSILLFNSQIWSPSLMLLRKLGSFHRKDLKWVSGLVNYIEALTRLDVLPICYLLIYYDHTYFFKLWNGYFDVSPVNYVRKANSGSDLRSSSRDYFVVQSCKKLKTECSSYNRVVRVSNFLIKKGVIEFQRPFSTFKAKVKSYLA